MTANFVCYIDNIYENSNDKSELSISPYSFAENPSGNIEDCTIPESASGVILFKNEIEGRDEFNFPNVTEFNPTDIKQYIVAENFLSTPQIYAKFSVPKSLMDGIIGAFVLRDGTLFPVTETQKEMYEMIPLNLIKDGKYQKPASTLS